MRGVFTYQMAYIVACVLFLLNVALAAIQAAYTAGHGADLGISPQTQAWLAIISTVVAAALGLLPAVHRTPGKRDARYLAASQGQLPEDVQKRYPMVIAIGEPPVTPSTPTSVSTGPPTTGPGV